MKYVIIHVIETLGRGGAEILFVNYINALPHDFENIVVYLKKPSTLESEIKNAKLIRCLDLSSKYGIPSAVLALIKIINENKVNLIHSHLYWPTIVARGANLGKLPHIFSVHTIMTYDAFKPNRLSKYLEKLSYSQYQRALFVSGAARADYSSHIPLNGESSVLYNFIRDEYFEHSAHKVAFNGDQLKLVAIGNLRPQKGHLFLIKCLQELSGFNISLDIYGEGDYRDELENYMITNRLTNVRLMGSEPQLYTKLKDYDAFLLATKYEGFCLAMAEAMAVGLPCVVPSIDALVEVSGESQLYYTLNDTNACKEKILMLYQNIELIRHYSSLATKRATLFTKAKHVDKLARIYIEELR